MSTHLRPCAVARAAARLAAVALFVGAALAGACSPEIRPSPASPTPSSTPGGGLPTAGPSEVDASSVPQATPPPASSPTPSPTAAPFSIVNATTCDPKLVPGSTFPLLTPGPQSRGAQPLTLHVPILEYHRIVPLKQAGRSLAGLVVVPEDFDSQMAAFSGAGWHTITLATVADDLAAGVTPPPHSFVVTLDDGWWDSYTYAYPILQKYGFVGTFFVIADRIGTSSFLGPLQIETMAAAGNEIGDHTLHHSYLTALQPAALTAQIDTAAATIASITGRWPQTLAYPHGRTNALVRAAVAACKPLQMAVVEGGSTSETWANRFAVGRIQVGPGRKGADLLAQVQHVGR